MTPSNIQQTVQGTILRLLQKVDRIDCYPLFMDYIDNGQMPEELKKEMEDDKVLRKAFDVVLNAQYNAIQDLAKATGIPMK